MKILLFLLALVGIATLTIVFWPPHTTPPPKPANDSCAIVLTLSDGTQITIDSTKYGQVQRQGAVALHIDSGRITYHADTASSQVSELYNAITVPRGRIYTLALSDGSIVTLNAASSLRYPIAFAGSDRTVHLEGEAYFEVSAGDHPFTVTTKELTIVTTKAQFNIRVYADGRFSTVTVVKGKLRAFSLDDNCIVPAGEQAKVSNDSIPKELRKKLQQRRGL